MEIVTGSSAHTASKPQAHTQSLKDKRVHCLTIFIEASPVRGVMDFYFFLRIWEKNEQKKTRPAAV